MSKKYIDKINFRGILDKEYIEKRIVMIIIGLECPCCASRVLDNGNGSCPNCNKEYPAEIRRLQDSHHAQKMQNVGHLKAGDMTMIEALDNLPRVHGQSEDKIVVTVPGQEKPQKIDIKKKMSCDGCEAVAKVFRTSVQRIKRIFA